MQQVAKLDAQAKPPLIHTTAWVYQAGTANSVRFDIGVEDGKVRRIFTRLRTHCLIQKMTVAAIQMAEKKVWEQRS